MNVLVLDDEILVHEVLAGLLNHLGHEVDAVTSGEEALSTYSLSLASGEPYDAVIVDLHLDGSGMDGGEAAERFLDLDPDAALIVSTGASGNPAVVNYSEHGFVACLQKPYGVKDLIPVLDAVSIKNEKNRRNNHVETP